MCTKETTLVLGSTGVIGRRVAERLWDGGYRIRAGSRHGDPAFDWHDPAGWPAVVDGASTLYVTVPADLEREGQEWMLARFLEVASRAGARRVVFRSRRGDRQSRSFERVVQAAGMDWTIVRMARFAHGSGDSFLAERNARGEVAVPAANAGESWVDVDDVAEAVVAILTSGGHAGRIYDLTGPGPVIHADV